MACRARRRKRPQRASAVPQVVSLRRHAPLQPPLQFEAAHLEVAGVEAVRPTADNPQAAITPALAKAQAVRPQATTVVARGKVVTMDGIIESRAAAPLATTVTVAVRRVRTPRQKSTTKKKSTTRRTSYEDYVPFTAYDPNFDGSEEET